MTITKRDYILIILLLIFLIGGLYGSLSVDFIEGDKAIAIALKWFIIPSIFIGIYYAYYSTITADKKAATWKNYLKLIFMTGIFFLIFLKSFYGCLILYNCNIGTKSIVILKGHVTSLDYPKRKKLLNSYKIVIEKDQDLQKIKLDVPTNKYIVGQIFVKEMTLGSLGLLYSRD